MSRRRSIVLFSLIGLSLLLPACGGSETQSSFLFDEEPATRPDVPEQYSGLVNPYVEDSTAISAGETIFEADCAACHGLTGEGDGPASGGLNPPPTNLAERQANMSDAYIFWRISEGGLMEPFNSIMPGWKGLLDEQQIWQIIAYIRTMVVL
ncbi:MAG: c-type cytochrome [Anaerolineales bacterium]|jgi:mono/diheme cytochrome c family protein